MTDISNPDRGVIRDVMDACDCSEPEAINALKHSDNNPAKAKIRYKTLMKYMPVRPNSPSVKSSLLRSKASIENNPAYLSDDSPGYEVVAPTSTGKTGDESVSKSQTGSRLVNNRENAQGTSSSTSNERIIHGTTVSPSIPEPKTFAHVPDQILPQPSPSSVDIAITKSEQEQRSTTRKPTVSSQKVFSIVMEPDTLQSFKRPEASIQNQPPEQLQQPQELQDPQQASHLKRSRSQLAQQPLASQQFQQTSNDVQSSQLQRSRSQQSHHSRPRETPQSQQIQQTQEPHRIQQSEHSQQSSQQDQSPLSEHSEQAEQPDISPRRLVKPAVKPRLSSQTPTIVEVDETEQTPAESVRESQISTADNPVIVQPSRITRKPSKLSVVPHRRGDTPISSVASTGSLKAAQYEQRQGHTEQMEWNFMLPRLSTPTSLEPDQVKENGFNLQSLVAALQHGATEQAVHIYLTYFDPHTVNQHINDLVAGIPSIFYAVATNNDRIVRRWLAHGAKINAVEPRSHVPLLAFAIAHSETLDADTSHIVVTLLSLGASAHSIPSAFYKPYFRDLPAEGPSQQELRNIDKKTISWLTPATCAKLARTTHLTNRYNLERATKILRPSEREWQVAHRKNAGALLSLPYCLIGQSMGSTCVLQNVLNYLAGPQKRPLVLLLAGPSGHGKKELARWLAYLINLELEVVDCSISREGDLFDRRHSYPTPEQGTPLNNFLAKNHGQRSIVFLSAFEKTTTETHQALLLPFDNGEYQDRRTLAKIDCSKTIWILSTNMLCHSIKNFCDTNGDLPCDDQDQTTQSRLLKELSKELRQEFQQKYEAPLTARISAFVPFLYFSPGEQAAITHRYLLELGHEVRSPVNLSAGFDESLIGNVRLRLRKDAVVCQKIAEEGYHPELGARSLMTAIDPVRAVLVESYLKVNEAISEAAEPLNFVVDINEGSVVASLELPKAQNG